MAVSTKDELVAALERGDFAALLGTVESEWVEFKSEVYPLDAPKGPREYAKDVAAFANSAGGLIVVGYKTGKTETDLESKALEHTPVPKQLVDPKKLADVLGNIVFPTVQGVRSDWFPGGSEPHGVLVVSIPEQHPYDKPFIVRKLASEDVHAFGIPRRSGAHTSWVHTESMHGALSRAELVQALLAALANSGNGELPSVFQRFAALAAAPSNIPDAVPSSPEESVPTHSGELTSTNPESVQRSSDLTHDVERRANDRITAIRREMEWQTLPSYFLQALQPGVRRSLKNIHSASGIRGSLRHPPILRPLGWHLATGCDPEVREGGLVVIEGSRSIIWLERDGLFTAGALATPEFLGWGLNRDRENGPGPFNLNSLSLVEYTLEFFRFVYRVLTPHAAGPQWAFRIVTRGFKTASGGVQLREGPPEAWHFSAHPASGDDLEEYLQGTGDAGTDALTALESVYGLFGLGAEHIPFQQDGRISEALITARR